MAGAHVFGDGRLGCWIIPSSNLVDKLRHRVPLIKTAFGVTDFFLPREAGNLEKQVVRNSECFVALWEPPPHGKSAAEYAAQALGDTHRLSVGALELNIEGVPDDKLSAFVTEAVRAIRTVKPQLRLRVNLVPFKARFLPALLFQSDPQLYLIVQNYFGNMDARAAEDELVRDCTDFGIPAGKVSIMYGAHIGQPRVRALPSIRFRGSLYQDDLLSDAGYI
jgi:hypothetical protein